jgi:limonene-1,2-epoxide hydrolase
MSQTSLEFKSEINMTDQEEANIQIVLDFFKAWEGGQPGDMAAAYDKYLADDCLYENTGLPGFNKEDTMKFFFSEPRSEDGIIKLVAEMHAVAADGNTVYTERTDHHYDKDGNDVLTPKISGIFVVKDGRFSRWSDYFDPRHMLEMFDGRLDAQAAE